MKLLGIDYGRRRIGVAVTDESGVVVRGCATIDRQKINNPITELDVIVRRESPAGLVVGVPLGPHDEETVMSAEVRDFIGRFLLETGSALPVHFIDESYSSSDSQILLRTRKKKQRRDRALIDRIAACHILESFLRQYPCNDL
jgi:putative Holliday junction resolvase